MSTTLQQNKGKLAATLYVMAGLFFFGLTVFFVSTFQSSLSNPESPLANQRNFEDIPVSNQFLDLAVENTLVNYSTSELTNAYNTEFEYIITNQYNFGIRINTAFNSLSQAGEPANILQIGELSNSGQVAFNEQFDTVNNLNLLQDPLLLLPGESIIINSEFLVEFLPDDSPVRNTIEVSGIKVNLPVSYPVSYSAEQIEEIKETEQEVGGSAVSIFYPGIELEI